MDNIIQHDEPIRLHLVPLLQAAEQNRAHAFVLWKRYLLEFLRALEPFSTTGLISLFLPQAEFQASFANHQVLQDTLAPRAVTAFQMQFNAAMLEDQNQAPARRASNRATGTSVASSTSAPTEEPDIQAAAAAAAAADAARREFIFKLTDKIHAQAVVTYDRELAEHRRRLRLVNSAQATIHAALPTDLQVLFEQEGHFVLGTPQQQYATIVAAVGVITPEPTGRDKRFKQRSHHFNH